MDQSAVFNLLTFGVSGAILFLFLGGVMLSEALNRRPESPRDATTARPPARRRRRRSRR